MDEGLVKKQCVIKRVKEIHQNIKKAEKKVKLFIDLQPEVHRLDIQKMRSVYVPLIENSDKWENEFWSYALKKGDCFQKTISPQKIKEMYFEWGK